MYENLVSVAKATVEKGCAKCTLYNKINAGELNTTVVKGQTYIVRDDRYYSLKIAKRVSRDNAGVYEKLEVAQNKIVELEREISKLHSVLPKLKYAFSFVHTYGTPQQAVGYIKELPGMVAHGRSIEEVRMILRAGIKRYFKANSRSFYDRTPDIKQKEVFEEEFDWLAGDE